jgi:hypothetical protein
LRVIYVQDLGAANSKKKLNICFSNFKDYLAQEGATYGPRDTNKSPMWPADEISCQLLIYPISMWSVKTILTIEMWQHLFKLA